MATPEKNDGTDANEESLSTPQSATDAAVGVIDFQSLGRAQNPREQFLIEVIDRYRALLAAKDAAIAAQKEALDRVVRMCEQYQLEGLHTQSLLAVLTQETPKLVERITFSGFPPADAADVATENKSQ